MFVLSNKNKNINSICHIEKCPLSNEKKIYKISRHYDARFFSVKRVLSEKIRLSLLVSSAVDNFVDFFLLKTQEQATK